MFWVLLTLGMVSSNNCQITLNRLKPTGILFEPLSPALIYQSQWNIFTKISVVNEDDTLNFMESCEDAVTKLCTLAEHDSNFCLHWNREIKNVVTKIRSQLASINFYLSSSRKKRELIDAVGKISKYLFGTMDSEDAKDIYNRLQRLEEHDKESVHILNKQVTLMKTSFDSISKNFQNLSIYQNQLYTKVSEFSRKVNSEITKMSLELQAVHLKADMNELFIYILTSLQSVHNHINEYFAIINSLQQHRLHPLIIAPKTLLQIYSDITKTSQQPSVDFHLLNQIIKVYFVHHERDMFIKIKLPLLQDEKFILNKVHLFPMIISGHSAIMDIETSFVLNGTQRNHFIPMTSEEFNNYCIKCNCKEYPTVYICAQKQIKFIGLEKGNCLLSVMNNVLSEESHCKYRLLEEAIEFLVKLVRDNAWLFSFQKSRSLLSHCDKTTSHVEINGTGILVLNEPCKYTMGTIEIPYEGNNDITLPFHQPDIIHKPRIPSLPKNFKPKVFSNRTNIDIPPLLKNSHHNYNYALKANSKALEDFEAELSQLEKSRKVEIQQAQTQVNTGILTLVILLIIVFSVMYFRRTCRQKRIDTLKPKENNDTINPATQDPSPTPKRSKSKPNTNVQQIQDFISENSVQYIPTPPPIPIIANPNKTPGKVSALSESQISPKSTVKNKSFRIKI